MTKDEFDAAHRAFRRRRPFREFSIEFFSGTRIRIRHPEVVRNEGSLYVVCQPDGNVALPASGGVYPH